MSVFGYPGAGKTLLAEMAISKEIDGGGKVLYCTPYKALDWQKYNDFKESFKVFSGLKVAVADGDSKSLPKDLTDAKIIISTFERVLSAIRSKEPWLETVSLVCADELTLLADKDRGGTLDTLLTSFAVNSKRRIITLSSLVGNALEIAGWLGAEAVIENRPVFDKPIQEWIVFKENGMFYKRRKSGEKEELVTDGHPIDAIVKENLASGMTTIVFTGTRGGTETIADRLKKLHRFNPELGKRADDFLMTLEEDTSQLRKLCDMIGYGLAYHHAGLQRKARRFLEELIRDGSLRTIVATTTLSHGVDYKIDSVVVDIDPMIMVKRELPMFEYVNLKGRTGRPGKSKNAAVYIVCNRINPDQMFTKYFLSSPEDIFPLSTLQESNIGAMMLSEAIVDMDRISSFLERTFQYQHSANGIIPLQDVAEQLLAAGFLESVSNNLVVTGLGRKVNKSGLSPPDAVKVLSLKETSPDALLDLASRIDIVKKLSLSNTPVRVAMLKAWMRGKSLDEIRETVSGFDDQDLIELASYTSLSLSKMEVLYADRKVKKRIQKLRKKLNR